MSWLSRSKNNLSFAFREFYGVAEKIENNLPSSVWVWVDLFWNQSTDVKNGIESFHASLDGDYFQAFSKVRADIEFLEDELHFVVLYLHRVQHVVDLVEK